MTDQSHGFETAEDGTILPPSCSHCGEECPHCANDIAHLEEAAEDDLDENPD